VPKNAQYAANLINEKEKIIINGGTTFSLIPNYIEQKNITVLTNSSNTGFNSFLENYMKVQKI
jgi:DeoR/GlpR family transcriptional regulator of sugar metabolism